MTRMPTDDQLKAGKLTIKREDLEYEDEVPVVEN